jgi:hypothetical protein
VLRDLVRELRKGHRPRVVMPEGEVRACDDDGDLAVVSHETAPQAHRALGHVVREALSDGEPHGVGREHKRVVTVECVARRVGERVDAVGGDERARGVRARFDPPLQERREGGVAVDGVLSRVGALLGGDLETDHRASNTPALTALGHHGGPA